MEKRQRRSQSALQLLSDQNQGDVLAVSRRFFHCLQTPIRQFIYYWLFCQGHFPDISTSSVKLRNVRISTTMAKTPID